MFQLEMMISLRTLACTPSTELVHILLHCTKGIVHIVTWLFLGMCVTRHCYTQIFRNPIASTALASLMAWLVKNKKLMRGLDFPKDGSGWWLCIILELVCPTLFFHDIQDTSNGIFLMVLLETMIHINIILIETVGLECQNAGSLSMWHLGQTLVDGNNDCAWNGSTMERKWLLAPDLQELGFECFLKDNIGHVQIRSGVMLWVTCDFENCSDEICFMRR